MMRVRSRIQSLVRVATASLAGAGLAGAAIAGLGVTGTVLTPRTALADPPIRSWLDRAIVAAATRRAIARAGLSPDALHDLATRARTAGLLPDLSVRVMRGLGAASALNAALPTSDRYTSDDSLVVDLRAHFELDRLVFDRSEVTLQRIELVRQERREALEREVIEQLAILARVSAGAGTPADPANTPSIESQIAAARARARLESMTGTSLEVLARGR